jgi:hypothetical protein
LLNGGFPKEFHARTVLIVLCQKQPLLAPCRSSCIEYYYYAMHLPMEELQSSGSLAPIYGCTYRLPSHSLAQVCATPDTLTWISTTCSKGNQQNIYFSGLMLPVCTNSCHLGNQQPQTQAYWLLPVTVQYVWQPPQAANQLNSLFVSAKPCEG